MKLFFFLSLILDEQRHFLIQFWLNWNRFWRKWVLMWKLFRKQSKIVKALFFFIFSFFFCWKFTFQSNKIDYFFHIHFKSIQPDVDNMLKRRKFLLSIVNVPVSQKKNKKNKCTIKSNTISSCDHELVLTTIDLSVWLNFSTVFSHIVDMASVCRCVELQWVEQLFLLYSYHISISESLNTWKTLSEEPLHQFYGTSILNSHLVNQNWPSLMTTMFDRL